MPVDVRDINAKRESFFFELYAFIPVLTSTLVLGINYVFSIGGHVLPI